MEWHLDMLTHGFLVVLPAHILSHSARLGVGGMGWGDEVPPNGSVTPGCQRFTQNVFGVKIPSGSAACLALRSLSYLARSS